MILTHQQLTVPTLTSCDVNGTSIPMPPDRVVYTRDSEPPGISVAFCSDITTSPMWKLMTTSACKNIHRYTARLKTTRDVRNRFYYFGSFFFFEKLKDSVRNEFGSVKKMQFGLDVSYLLLTRVIAEQLIYSKYYSDSG